MLGDRRAMQVKDLKANPKNPRTISQARLTMLKAALAEFGDLGGIVFNSSIKQLVGGHQHVLFFCSRLNRRAV